MGPVAVGVGDAGFLADAIADELREKLRALARQLADLQVAVIAKDAHIAQLGDSKAAMGRKFGVPVTERQAGESSGPKMSRAMVSFFFAVNSCCWAATRWASRRVPNGDSQHPRLLAVRRWGGCPTQV